jgi:hypothetical protein
MRRSEHLRAQPQEEELHGSQAPVTPRLYSLLLCYVSCMCAEIDNKKIVGTNNKFNK